MLMMSCLMALMIQAQTELNEKGEYELKIVREYVGLNAGSLFDRTLVALSDIKGGCEYSKFNYDVKEKDGGIIVYKGKLFVGYRKVNISGGYDYMADCTLKVRLKDGKAQYTMTVPTMTVYWAGNPEITDQVPLSNLLPEYNYKGKLYYVKKGFLEFAPKVSLAVQRFIDELCDKTAKGADDDF